METIAKMNLGKGGPIVSKLGLGCMRMTSFFGTPAKDEQECIATIHEALDLGINFLNTGDFYSNGLNELLVGKAIKDRRDKAFISVKFGAMFNSGDFLGLDLRPAAIKNFVNYSLARLGVETIDLYQPCRLDNSVPVEDVVGTIAELIEQGKVRYLGLSEITAEQLRKAHGVYPVTALEKSYSLADREIEAELLTAARELGIAIVAFGNTSNELLTGTMKAPLEPNDFRNHIPRYQGQNLIKNLEKVEVLKTIAGQKGYTPTQVAIAWVLNQGEDIMALVGMSRRSRLHENCKALEITFTDTELHLLNTTFAPGAIIGAAYPDRT
ncbi:MAG: aldo/keto reductase [Bacteroidia bacterium 44-10]|nr:MAG: aldo/keto reductase [Bacteroidia bacterium 44-10]